MKNLFIFVIVFLLFVFTTINHTAYASFETDFAFQMGDTENKVTTFKFLGEQRNMSVRELKNMLKTLGYGNYFANDESEAGYTHNVDRAFKEYVGTYQDKLRAAEKELQKQPLGG